MSSLREYFQTDWSAMTASDWVGMSITVVVFLLMCGVYFYALRPKNRERLESYRHLPLEDDFDSGEKR